MRTRNGPIEIARAVFRDPVGEAIENRTPVGIARRRPMTRIAGTVNVVRLARQRADAVSRQRRGIVGHHDDAADGDQKRHGKKRAINKNPFHTHPPSWKTVTASYRSILIRDSIACTRQ